MLPICVKNCEIMDELQSKPILKHLYRFWPIYAGRPFGEEGKSEDTKGKHESLQKHDQRYLGSFCSVSRQAGIYLVCTKWFTIGRWYTESMYVASDPYAPHLIL